jgi:hypothetical protein
MMDQELIDSLTHLAQAYPVHSRHRIMLTDELGSAVHKVEVVGFTVVETGGVLQAMVRVRYPDAQGSTSQGVTGAFTEEWFERALADAKAVVAGSTGAFNALIDRLRPHVREAQKLGFDAEEILTAASMGIE